MSNYNSSHTGLEIDNGVSKAFTSSQVKTFDVSQNSDEFTQAQMQDIYTNKYDVITIISSESLIIGFKALDFSESSGGVGYLSYLPNGEGITGNVFVYDTDTQQYMVQTELLIPRVDGTNDGTNWTSITIGGTTKNIPTGGLQTLVEHTITAEEIAENGGAFNQLDFNDITDLAPGSYYFITEYQNDAWTGIVPFEVIDMSASRHSEFICTGTARIDSQPGCISGWEMQVCICYYNPYDQQYEDHVILTNFSNGLDEGVTYKLLYKPF